MSTASQRWIPACSWACPVGTDVAGMVALISEDRHFEAYRAARRLNPLAAICSRICTAPCEQVCCRSEVDSPVAIRALERFVVDLFEDHDSWRPSARTRRKDPSSARVAVVGSGPAGLACAYELALRGYGVTIFEAAPRAGGMLRLAIPASRLPEVILDREIESVLALGVDLRTNVRLGREMTLAELLLDGFGAVFLALGAGRPRRPQVSVEGGPRLLDGAAFLRRARSGGLPRPLGRTAVIAGAASALNGEAFSAAMTGEQANLQRRLMMTQALDVAREARKLGATKVTVCTLEARSECSAEEAEISKVRGSGVVFRHRVVADRLLGGEEGSGVELLKVARLFGPDGHFAPVYRIGSQSLLRADTVVVVGDRCADLSCLEPADGVATHDGRIIVDPDSLATTATGVFAGGDAAFGSRDVVNAIADGKRAAAAIDLAVSRRARRSPPESGREPSPCPPADEITDAGSAESPGWSATGAGPGRALRPLTAKKARSIARRCLRCPAPLA